MSNDKIGLLTQIAPDRRFVKGALETGEATRGERWYVVKELEILRNFRLSWN